MIKYVDPIAKRAAQRHLETMHERIKCEKPFRLDFDCAGWHWSAYAPEVVTSPEGRSFVISHQLVGEPR